MSVPTQPTGAIPSDPAGTAPAGTAPVLQSAAQPNEDGLMTAVVQDGYGSTDVLRVMRMPRPEIAGHDVLVRVHAAGLAKGAWHMMTGTPYLLRAVAGLRSPRQQVLGNNLAGTVAAVGSAVTRFSVGDEVYGVGRGTFAHYCAARADKLALKPASLSFEQAAVVPVSGLTALQAVADVGRVGAGQRVLVLGAAGGVGSFAVQVARAAGAEVTGACRGSKADFVRSLGAAHVLDYARQDFADGSECYDVIINIAGNPKLARLCRALTRRGTAVIVGGEEGGRWTGGMIQMQVAARVLSLFTGQHLTSSLCKERGSDLERLTTLIESGEVQPRIDSSYPLADAARAMQRLESGDVRGSVVLMV